MKKDDLSKMLIAYSQCQPFGAPDFKSSFVIDFWFKVLGHMEFGHVAEALHVLCKKHKFPHLQEVEDLVCREYKDLYVSEESMKAVLFIEAEENKRREKRGLAPHEHSVPKPLRLPVGHQKD